MDYYGISRMYLALMYALTALSAIISAAQSGKLHVKSYQTALSIINFAIVAFVIS